jgi:outer membrane autotransporter protein
MRKITRAWPTFSTPKSLSEHAARLRQSPTLRASLAILCAALVPSASGIALAQENLANATTGDNQHGYQQFSNNFTFNNIVISTSGQAADGLRLGTFAPRVTANSLDVETRGLSSDGLLITRDSHSGLIQINGPTRVVTQDGMALRVAASISDGTVAAIELNGNSTITTSGPGNFNSGYAVYAGVDGGCGVVPGFVNADCASNGDTEVRLSGGPNAIHTIRTSGAGAHAVYALGRGHVELENVDIATSGAGASGIVAARRNQGWRKPTPFDFAQLFLPQVLTPQDFSGSVNLLGNVTIATTGTDAYAMYVDSFSEADGQDSRGAIATIRSFDRSTNTVVSDRVYRITGDLRAVNSGVIDLHMGNGSQFLGATSLETEGQISLTVAGLDSRWTLTKDSVLSSLSLAENAQLFAFDTVAVDNARRLTGNVVNAGAIAISKGDAVGSAFTIEGNYVGNNGTLLLNATLGADSSPTDRFVVTGDTSGATGVRLRNIGGSGAPTTEGIKIVEVGGASLGTFNLFGDFVHKGAQAVIAGPYAYTLHKGSLADANDGAWYLRSALVQEQKPDPDPDRNVDPDPKPVPPLYQPAVPLYEAYPKALLGLVDVSTLKQRVGNRTWGAGEAERDAQAGWVSLQSRRAQLRPDHSLTDFSAGQNIWGIALGADMPLYQNERSRLVTGLSGSFQQSQTEVSSPHAGGALASSAIGLGATLTWYDETGFYLDAQGQVRWMSSDITSNDLGRIASAATAFGYAVSVEGGFEIPLSETLSLTPQAQLIQKSVSFDPLTQQTLSGPVLTSLVDGNVTELRLGLALDDKRSWTDADGSISKSNLYAISNLYYALDGHTSVSVDGLSAGAQDNKFAAGLGLGGTLNLKDDAISLYGELEYRTDLSSARGNALGAKAGFRVAF